MVREIAYEVNAEEKMGLPASPKIDCSFSYMHGYHQLATQVSLY